MGTLYLVRHGQASFGAADYDQLSELGARQSRLLGDYWRQRGQRFDAVLTGTLKRHRQTFAGIADGLGDLPTPMEMPGLNEYDSEALIRAIHPAPLEKPRDAEMVRSHFRLLRTALQAWMRGETKPQGMPSYAEFSAGVAQVLQAPSDTAIELNLRIRNSAVTEFSFNPKRHVLQTFNGLPHLDLPELSALVTSA